MTERIDHYAAAVSMLQDAETAVDMDLIAAIVQGAQVHATLALAEQQRVANLIALSQAADGNGWQAREPLEVIYGYDNADAVDEFSGLHIRFEIKEALGL